MISLKSAKLRNYLIMKIAEKGYRREEFKRTLFWFVKRRGRIEIWLVIVGLILSANFIIAPNPRFNTAYVPNMANGLVTSMSILMAFAVFSVNHFHATIEDDKERKKFKFTARSI